jgi:hypothetical protein
VAAPWQQQPAPSPAAAPPPAPLYAPAPQQQAAPQPGQQEQQGANPQSEYEKFMQELTRKGQ